MPKLYHNAYNYSIILFTPTIKRPNHRAFYSYRKPAGITLSLFSCHPCLFLVISDFLFHDDSRLELNDQFLGRDYFDA